MLFSASAPGSLMLLGEYAVLYGKHALVCAVNKRMRVTLTPRQDDRILLHSALGHYETTLSALTPVVPFQFVLTALQYYPLSTGCEIQIASEFSDKMGFASSAAVTVATLAAVKMWLDHAFHLDELFEAARQVVRDVQGMGSGADVAACVYGGMINYRMNAMPEKIETSPRMTVVYSGSKTPTVEAITHVDNRFARDPATFQRICDNIDECAIAGIAAARGRDWNKLGSIMDSQQEWMNALGVNTPIIQKIIDDLRMSPDILGAKISGSGLGDCVVALGDMDYCSSEPNVKKMPVEITQEGVRCEKT